MHLHVIEVSFETMCQYFGSNKDAKTNLKLYVSSFELLLVAYWSSNVAAPILKQLCVFNNDQSCVSGFKYSGGKIAEVSTP